MSKNCALSFKKDREGFCNTIVNGKLRVKQTARIEKTLAVENNLQVYNDANIGDTVNTCNITIKNQLIYSEPELINQSGETLSQLKSLSFINTNGVGELEDGCCNGLYKQIVKINDSEEIGWTSVGNTGDINQAVNTIAFGPSGDGPYIGGDFTNVPAEGGSSSGKRYIVKWTGSNWTSILDYIDFPVRTIVFDQNGDGPYVGGQFNGLDSPNTIQKIGYYTGSSWTSIGNDDDFNGYRVEIIAFNPITGEGPYVGCSSILKIAGITGLDYLAKWGGTSVGWTSVGNTGDINGNVYSIAFGPSGDGPYIGGGFSNVAGITGLNSLALWTGSSWTSVSGNTGDFNFAGIYSIAFKQNGDGPYIGGFFQDIAGITGLNGLAKWGGTSIGWTSISGNTGDIREFDQVNSIIFSPNGDGPYIGGNLFQIAGITGLNSLALWTGSSWISVSGNAGDFNFVPVNTIAFDTYNNDNGPYVGGDFSNVAGITGLNKLAKYDTNTFGYELTYNDTETLTLTNKGDEATLIYNSDPTAGWIKLT